MSSRLQHTERMIPNPAYPYARNSPRLRTPTAARTLSSTASSTTLNSQSSCGSDSRIPRLRRSLSSISNTSDSFIPQSGIDPRVQRIRRAESFAGSALYPPGSPLKCVPSFGSLAKRSSDAMSVDCSNRSDVTTSDEEEKLRSKKAKKARVKASSPTPPSPSSPAVPPVKSKQLRRTTKQISKTPSHGTPKDSSRRPSRTKVTTQRNSSFLGPELPIITSQAPELRRSLPTPSPAVRPSRKLPTIKASPSRGMSVCQTPAPSSPKTLRRTVGPSLGRSGVGRKISFTSLPAAQEEDPVLGAGLGLEGAFQLQ